MIIYRILNRVNGKVYIGKISLAGKTIQDRLHEHFLRPSNRHLAGASRKYGPDAFTVEVIYRAKTPVELSKMETFFIVLHQSFKPENGYNMTMGGEGGPPTEEVRRRLSVITSTRLKENHPFRGKKMPNIGVAQKKHWAALKTNGLTSFIPSAEGRSHTQKEFQIMRKAAQQRAKEGKQSTRLGIPMSVVSKQRLSDSQKARWAARRGA